MKGSSSRGEGVRDRDTTRELAIGSGCGLAAGDLEPSCRGPMGRLMVPLRCIGGDKARSGVRDGTAA